MSEGGGQDVTTRGDGSDDDDVADDDERNEISVPQIPRERPRKIHRSGAKRKPPPSC